MTEVKTTQNQYAPYAPRAADVGGDFVISHKVDCTADSLAIAECIFHICKLT
jgi:hypothetical protein